MKKNILLFTALAFLSFSCYDGDLGLDGEDYSVPILPHNDVAADYVVYEDCGGGAGAPYLLTVSPTNDLSPDSLVVMNAYNVHFVDKVVRTGNTFTSGPQQGIYDNTYDLEYNYSGEFIGEDSIRIEIEVVYVGEDFTDVCVIAGKKMTGFEEGI